MNIADYIKLLATLFAVVNPISIGPLFLAFTANQKKDRPHIARITSISAALIMVISAFVGTYILQFFGLTINGFRIAGGLLLLIIALNMFFPKDADARQTDEEIQEAVESKQIAVVPLAMPLLAGPGTISTIILLSSRYESLSNKAIIASACVLIAFVIWICMLMAPRIGSRIGTTGMNVVTRIMGLVLATLAVDFILNGLKNAFTVLAS